MKLAILALACFVAVSEAQFPRPSFGGLSQAFKFQPQQYKPKPAVRVDRPAYEPIPVARKSYSGNEQTATILKYGNDNNPDGSYNYFFETDNGIAAQAQGTPRDFGGNPPAVIPVVSQGSYSYTSPDGVPVSITYIADENGYQPQGAAIPTSPPVPEAILRALDYIARSAPRK